MLKFFHLAKNASPFISVGSMNLLSEMGTFNDSLCGCPLMLKLTLMSENIFLN
jgi:hypothetical protein